MESIKELVEKRAKLSHDCRAILAKAEGEKRECSAEERSEYDRIEAECEALSDRIDAKRWQQDKLGKQKSQDDKDGDEVARQVAPGNPGASPKKAGDDGAALTFDFGRAGKVPLNRLSTVDKSVADRLRARAGEDYQLAFSNYLLRGGESLALQTGNDPKGGYLAPMTFYSQLIKFLDDMVVMRRLGTVLPPTTSKSVGILSFDTDYADSDWTAEIPASDISEDDAARFGQREMMPHLLTKLIKCSRKMIRNSIFPLESFLAQRLAYRFAITENKAYLSGSGVQRPLGVFTASADGIPTSRDTTCSATTVFTADELIDMKESVKDAYQMKGTFLASREFRKRCRKLKSGDGNYLLVENNSGGITTLFERPLVIDENAPSTFTAAQYICVFGDFSFYYIQDGLDMEIQALGELFALTNQLGYLGRKETDAQPVLAEAFGRLILHS